MSKHSRAQCRPASNEPGRSAAEDGRAELETGAVHVWRASLCQPDAALERLQATLNQSELRRAASCRFETHRRRTLIARGFLRDALARYAGAPAAALEFGYGPQGKPWLLGNASWLEFNLSHSGDLAALAVSIRPVGIDVEQVRRLPHFESIARRFLSPAECAALAAVPPETREVVFFEIWCRKEAYIKALGGGLSIPLDRFSVPLAGAGAVNAGGCRPESGLWWVEGFGRDGYAGAIATPDGPAPLQFRDWTPY